MFTINNLMVYHLKSISALHIECFPHENKYLKRDFAFYFFHCWRIKGNFLQACSRKQHFKMYCIVLLFCYSRPYPNEMTIELILSTKSDPCLRDLIVCLFPLLCHTSLNRSITVANRCRTPGHPDITTDY